MGNTKSALGKKLLNQFSGKITNQQYNEEKIYAEVYGTTDIEKVEESLKKMTGFKGECGQVLMENSMVWGCLTCGLNQSAMICHECYTNSNHEGHQIFIRRGIKGGRCDCGDSDAWASFGSCSRHAHHSTNKVKAPEEMLPESIRTRAVNILNDLVIIVNSLCLNLESEIGLTGEVVTNLQETKKLHQQIEFIAKVLAHFIEINPVFLHLIAMNFLESSSDSLTKHHCISDLKSSNTLLNNNFSNSHPCTCNHLHNLVKIITSFPDAQQLFIGERILIPLMCNQDFKFCIGLSYFANYPCIVPYIYDETILVEISLQFLGYENVVQKILNDDVYFTQIFNQLKRIFSDLQVSIKLGLPICRILIKQLNLVCQNLKKLMHPKLLKFYYPCLVWYVECLGVFHSIGRTAISNEGLQEIAAILESQFTCMLSAFDTSEIEQCVILIKAFETALEKVSGSQNNVIILHRCLSMFLSNYLVNNYWEHCANSKDPINIESTIRKMVTSLWELSSIEDTENIAIRWLPGVLQSIGADLNFHPKNEGQLMNFPGESYNSSSLDFCLMTILLSLLKPRKNLLNWLILLINPTITHEDISTALSSSEKTTTYERTRSTLEISMHTICTWISNDILFYGALMNYRRTIIFTKDIIERTKRTANSYFEYCIARYIVLLFSLRPNPSEGITFTTIQNLVPDRLKDFNKIEKVLEKLTTASIDLREHIIKFKLQSDSLNLFDPFLVISSKLKIYNLPFKWNAHDPIKADFLFGECAVSNQYTGKSKTGLPLIPFKQLITQLFAESGMITEIMKLIQSQGVTSWIMTCAYKLLLACMKYEKDEALIAEAWRVMGENIEKFMIDYPYNSHWEIVLKNYQKLINERSKKAIASHLDEVLALKRKEQQEQKARCDIMKQRIKERFAAKNKAFTEKHSELLSKSKKDDWEICAYCRETIDKYSDEPFGIQMLMQRSIIYGNYLNQVLKTALGEYYNEETKFKHVMGRSKGIVFTTCQHCIHLKCCAELLKNPPEDENDKSDCINSEGIFLCPICQHCANILVPPANEILNNKSAAEYFESSVFSKVMKMYCKEDEDSNCIEFLTVCRCLAYHLNLITLNEVADFVAKKEVLLGLVYALRNRIRDGNYYENMQRIQEAVMRDLKFIKRGRYRVFRANISLIATMFLVASKIFETAELRDKIYEELKDKIILVIKFAVIQILLRIVYLKIDPAADPETLLQALGTGEWFYLPETLSALKERLVPFLKRIYCLRTLLWPIPGRDTLAEMVKTSWLCNKNSLEFYTKEFGLNNKFQVADMLEYPLAKKPAYVPLEEINLEWLSAALDSLVRNYISTGTHLMPKAIVVFDQQPFNFIPLPMYYSELNRMYQRIECENCGKIKEDWAICLLCGSVLCVLTSSRKLGDEGVGELTAHSRSCPGGAGVFLRILTNRIILIDGGYACNYISPYVNKYGESVEIGVNTETGVLRLDQRIVEKLKAIYLQHMVPQIVRAVWLKDTVKFKLFSL